MILVGSSVWIDYFNGQNTPQVELLDQLLSTQPLAIGDIILTEVLQGFRQDADYVTAKQILTSLTIFQLINTDLAINSADNFRTLRKRGITVRRTVDVIIATFCIEAKHALLFSDRDFIPFVQHLGLNAVRMPE
ncbi:type II toxin-antitoxin system VapC family toxin [Phormidium tenue]|uniref:VapC toxin family PIN domain ribonuclease n=1 Tax=Phormidium tenue NIES-30 TaxID=549789 RepID=A0A1U7J3Y5_9CYAN|nr:PIN domain nuclease [Phormidium tenue]MBD2233063.1 PIN domain nuclease [Phormidium tenue FACHB-1052]OKH47123.1 VapC toxin family PIN domain ribonuclease [Phormidium tenue NIES-30]